MRTLGSYPLFQHAYLVNDLEASVAKWNELFGAGPFMFRWHHRTDHFSYRGTPQEADVSYAFGYLGDVMIQFIQQHDDTPSIYREVYAPGEEGFHHVATLIHDYLAERQRFLDLGYELACELQVDGVDAAYFDTRAVTGGFTEIHTDPPRIRASFASWRRDHELFRPDDPLVIAPAPPR
jgi:Glyoxalase/Bleomycin resistance protein/Dioxygenase superfamily